MYEVKINDLFSLTHDVKRIITEKPKNYNFSPGQATEVAIKQEKWENEKRPFTFTSLPEDDFLEFVIKSYRDHDGVTNHIDNLVIGDSLLIDDPWGAIQYKGKGVFIAGGAGITPFIPIFKDLVKKGEIEGNKLIFANKTRKDVIMEPYFFDILDEDFISVLEKENLEGHEHGMINMEFLKKHINDFSQAFYVCGPDQMVKDIYKFLENLGADPEGIVFEK
ncbi:FAD-binding oxidoreductase [Cecembia lonarensis]|uniref:Naphthalene 1,2-dioxygenase system ferredoxin--NAD(+) reductase component n=1 Tax=Cecembia lonarensis (strain CCUG 58316 / KCTC 22772 / LW9) TaxID=1225176 RepID=K1LDR6_CECL9|nr:FAD-binding oxidoreductase [Cecembia lonarensis]EKB50252.1 Naphthalene 1,2-dioxygenase system ferredoxin--NAD(+) reductase component [Cecembia lonarensis LW9]